MTIFFHHLKINKTSLIIWSSVLSFMLGICIIIYPEMASQMDEISDMFANMGAFSDAFGMDKINFGEFIGYFGIECGNSLGLGGSLFAALIGISALSKEESGKTAEFLLTHPINRNRIFGEKLLGVVVQNLVLSLAVTAICTLCTLIIGEKVSLSFYLILLSFFILQLHISFISFGLSAFISKGGLGLGIGTAIGFYFINIVSNITDSLDFLKYFTPFAYTDSGYITENHCLDLKYVLISTAISIAFIILGILKYKKKDIK